MTQVITITPTGGLEGLQRKRGQGMDLRQFGKASIERVSEIMFDEGLQRWTVNIISGPMAGLVLDRRSWLAAGKDDWPKGCIYRTGFGLMTFEHYDDAVAVEVAFLDAMRVRGTF